MKFYRLLHFAILLIATIIIGNAPNAGAVEVTPKPDELEESPLRITSFMIQDGKPAYVQIFNDSNERVMLDEWKLAFLDSDEKTSEEITLPSSWILPGNYIVAAKKGAIDAADIEYATTSRATAFGGARLVASSRYLPRSIEGDFTESVRYDLSKSSAGNYVKTSKFLPASDASPLYGGGLYSRPDATLLLVNELLANPADCAPLSSELNCKEYVELYNPSADDIDLSQFRLRVGWASQTSSVTNTMPLDGMLPAGGHSIVSQRSDGQPLEITASGGAVWLEDAQGISPYASTVYQYPDIGGAAYKGYSWARKSDTTWQWTAATPGGVNDLSAVVSTAAETAKSESEPCRDDQYRNPDTNRCKLKASQSVTGCKEGQYRNPETNRCKSTTTASTSLAPCEEGKMRNPETNRCRSASLASQELTPCGEGKERNPETNRCRSAASGTPKEAAYAPQPVEATGQAFLGWWALGGVGVLALGRLGWEWREEIRGAAAKVGQVFTSGK